MVSSADGLAATVWKIVMSALCQKRTLRRLAGDFKLDVGNPIALSSAQAGLFILALES
jgi:hypothetical protein